MQYDENDQLIMQSWFYDLDPYDLLADYKALQ